MILLIDCGSTKADWTFIQGRNVVKRCSTNGFNPNFCDMNLISTITLDDSFKDIDFKCVTNVFFYGTGCGNEVNMKKMATILKGIFTYAEVNVFSDILGSCHALFGNEPGIACILGTGSNACLYDGKNIVKNAVSLGYVLGDEGSGCHIGKQIIHDYFYGIMPVNLREKFDDEYNLNRETLINKVYKEPQPSRFLASFTKFASENIGNQYIIELVSNCFYEFIKYYINPITNILDNKSASNVSDSISFVGSVAFYFQDILCQCLTRKNLQCGNIIQSPMEKLIEYYTK